MDWEIVKVNDMKNRSSLGSRAVPTASIGFGRLSINTAACELIENADQCQYIELLKGRHKGKVCIGVRLLTELQKTSDSIPVRRRMRKGIPAGGLDIHAKRALESLFGPAASATSTTKFSVAKDSQSTNILIVFAE